MYFFDKANALSKLKDFNIHTLASPTRKRTLIVTSPRVAVTAPVIPKVEWTPEDQALIAWFENYLGKLNESRSLEKYTRLEQEIAQGPSGPAAVTGSLQKELKELKWVIEFAVTTALNKKEDERTALERALLKKLSRS